VNTCTKPARPTYDISHSQLSELINKNWFKCQKGAFARFYILSDTIGFKLFKNAQIARKNLDRQLRGLELNIAPDCLAKLLDIEGHWGFFCERCKTHPLNTLDWARDLEPIIETYWPELEEDVGHSWNWGYRISDNRPVVYDFSALNDNDYNDCWGD